ncbi:MAG: hypothetical protein WBG13_21950, partial [Pseudolabrys sp.]
NSIAQTSVSHVSLRGDDAPADSLHWLMSALGQKQTFAVQNVMSALPPKADISRPTCDVT